MVAASEDPPPRPAPDGIRFVTLISAPFRTRSFPAGALRPADRDRRGYPPCLRADQTAFGPLCEAYGVRERDQQKDGFEQVITILPDADDMEKEIDFRRGRQIEKGFRKIRMHWRLAYR